MIREKNLNSKWPVAMTPVKFIASVVVSGDKTVGQITICVHLEINGLNKVVEESKLGA